MENNENIEYNYYKELYQKFENGYQAGENRLDEILIKSSVGIIGISFGFFALLLDKHLNSLHLFFIGLIFAILALSAGYAGIRFSTHSFADAINQLNENYKNKKLNEIISFKYTYPIMVCNKIGPLFLLISVLLLISFIYLNTNKDNNMVKDKVILKEETRIMYRENSSVPTQMLKKLDEAVVPLSQQLPPKSISDIKGNELSNQESRQKSQQSSQSVDDVKRQDNIENVNRNKNESKSQE